MQHRHRIAMWTLVALLAAGPMNAWAAEPGAPEGKPEPKGPPAAKPEQPEYPKFEEAMKDFTQVQVIEPDDKDQPLFTLWHNKKTDALRAQIPAGLIGQQFMIASSMSGGPTATGFQLDDFLAYFEKMNKQLVLMRVDPRYVEGSSPVTDVIKRSYGGNDILKTIPIITMQGGDAIIDLDSVFKNDFSEIGGMGGGAINPGLSKWAEFKVFPKNVELSVDLAFMRRGAGRRMQFHYSLSRIPKGDGFKPRAADDRVGYFMTVRKDWNKSPASKTLFDRYINRWNLQKSDDSAELSPVKEPITWYIEKTVPIKYRRYVKEGILEWNKAFEKCGFLDAVVVNQQENDRDRFGNLDPEDSRYNFFRWIVTGRGFAMGPSRAHPLTGQIFDADIVFDDAMARHYVSDYERLTGGEDSWDGYNPLLENFFKSHPQWAHRTPWENLLPNLKLQEDPDAELRLNLMKHMSQRGKPMCECSAGMARQIDFANVAMESKGLGRNNEEFIGQIIKEVVMHEVGHCLGLRHNFKASTWLTMDEIAKQNQAGEPNVGSVMDYNPPIISARGSEQGSFTTRSIGPYDYWAIEYGYRPVGKPHKSEEDMLKAITSRSQEPGLAYATDEDVMSILSPDPLSNRFDMGKDCMDYAKHQIKLTESLLEDIDKWAVKDGESYNRLRRAFTRVFSEKARASAFVARFVGGQYVNRGHKGDKDAASPLTNVEAAKQREAVKFVAENIFAEGAWKVKPELLAKLGPGHQQHWDSEEFDLRKEFNIHDVVGGAQYQCLFNLMNPFAIGRIHDNEVKFNDGEEAYTLSEHIRSVTDSIWGELDQSERKGTDRKPYINSFRRNLQRDHLGMLLDLVLSDPGGIVPADANAIARLTVAKLSEKVGKELKSGDLDTASEAHLTDVKKRIDKALEAQYMVGGGGAGGGGFFFFRPTPDKSETITILPQQ